MIAFYLCDGCEQVEMEVETVECTHSKNGCELWKIYSAGCLVAGFEQVPILLWDSNYFKPVKDSNKSSPKLQFTIEIVQVRLILAVKLIVNKYSKTKHRNRFFKPDGSW